MGRPSKFTDSRKEQILAVLKVGGSRETAAQVAGLSYETLRVWLKRGEAVAQVSEELGQDIESGYRDFREAVLAAEAEPRFRALGIIHRALPDKPELAFKYVERREPGYAPPQPGHSQAAPQVQINLSLTGSAAPLPSWIEGTVVEVDEPAPALPPGEPGEET